MFTKRFLSSVHKTSQSAFNANHKLYDQVRPEYPEQLLGYFIPHHLGLDKPGKKVLELAAGTGKFTKHLIGKCDLTVVEPSEGMLSTLKEKYPTVDAIQGSSFEIPMENESVDTVVVAQGFHWFANEESLKEIHRVLKPNGRFGMIWNFDAASKAQVLAPNRETMFGCLYPSEEFTNKANFYRNIVKTQTMNGLIQPNEEIFKLGETLCAKLTGWDAIANYAYQFDRDVPQYRKGVWRDVLNSSQLFTPAQELFYFNIDEIPVAQVYPYWESRSFITSLSDEHKKALEESLNTIVKNLEPYCFNEDRTSIKRFLSTHSCITTKVT